MVEMLQTEQTDLRGPKLRQTPLLREQELMEQLWDLLTPTEVPVPEGPLAEEEAAERDWPLNPEQGMVVMEGLVEYQEG